MRILNKNNFKKEIMEKVKFINHVNEDDVDNFVGFIDNYVKDQDLSIYKELKGEKEIYSHIFRKAKFEHLRSLKQEGTAANDELVISFAGATKLLPVYLEVMGF